MSFWVIFGGGNFWGEGGQYRFRTLYATPYFGKMCHRVTKIDNIFLTNASFAYSLVRWMDDLGLRLITMSSQIVCKVSVGVSTLAAIIVHTAKDKTL